MDERTIRGHCRTFQQSIDDNYGGKGLAVYASKAFNCKEMCRIIKDEGLGIDVVSGGELYTALSVDFPPEKSFSTETIKPRKKSSLLWKAAWDGSLSTI